MGHTYTSIKVHVVFSTSGRRALLPAELQPRVWDYIGGIGKKHNIPIHQVGGIDNHVHVLMSIPPTMKVSEAVQTLKAFSSKWLNEAGLMKGGRFSWQEGYAAFGVSQSNAEAVAAYIREQPQHHGKHSFEEELRSLLAKNEISFDERYLLG